MRADEQRADAGQHLQHLERVDVFLAAQQHARAAHQDQRILAEERRDRLEDLLALGGLADVKGVRTEVDGVVADLDRPAHAADRLVALEHGHRISELGQAPRRRNAGRPRAQDHDSLLPAHPRSRTPPAARRETRAAAPSPSSNAIDGVTPNRSRIVGVGRPELDVFRHCALVANVDVDAEVARPSPAPRRRR